MLELRHGIKTQNQSSGQVSGPRSVRPADQSDQHSQNRRDSLRFRSLLSKADEKSEDAQTRPNIVSRAPVQPFQKWMGPVTLEQDINPENPKSFSEAIEIYKKASKSE